MFQNHSERELKGWALFYGGIALACLLQSIISVGLLHDDLYTCVMAFLFLLFIFFSAKAFLAYTQYEDTH